MFVSGIVVTGIGALVALTGVYSLDRADSATCESFDGDNPDEGKAVGGGMAATRLIGAGVGVTIMILGGHKVPVKPAKRAASTAPELVLGPRYAGLRWST